TEETEKEMDEILKEIQNGKFAKEWALENRAGAPMLKRMRKLENELEIEEVGAKLRKLCGLEK
ncbi:MAG: ketol-acid reductoisomerase, partial [Methanothermobacter sp.]|nr:ketol-acid reductoisomerase [Methanothermobacter sp.]